MILTFLRHAPTPGNILSRYVGSTDEALAPEGIALARSIKPNEQIRQVHCSNLTRSVQTAAILYPNAVIIRHPGLDEMDFGLFEGKSGHDLAQNPEYKAWLESGCETPCPGGESKKAFTRRCCEAFLRIFKDYGPDYERAQRQLHFVIHSGTIMALMSAFATTQRDYFAWACGHCGGFVVESPSDNPRFENIRPVPSPSDEIKGTVHEG